jgi:hypothetical protein
MSCSGFYFALHKWTEWLKREKRLERKLKRIGRKYGWW